VIALLAMFVAAGQVAAQSKVAYPFRNPHLSVGQRVDDLLGRLTLDEKLSLPHQSQAPIARLGILYFKAGTGALHGVAWSNDSTTTGTRCSPTRRRCSRRRSAWPARGTRR
jgi:beta-glucosidase